MGAASGIGSTNVGTDPAVSSPRRARRVLVAACLGAAVVIVVSVVLAYLEVNSFLRSTATVAACGADCINVRDDAMGLAIRGLLEANGSTWAAVALYLPLVVLADLVALVTTTIALVLGRPSRLGRRTAMIAWVAAAVVVILIASQLLFLDTIHFATFVTE